MQNSELIAQLAFARSQKQGLEKDLTAKGARLFELEKVVASLNAAEGIVSKDAEDGKKSSETKFVETCSGAFCLKVQTFPSVAARATGALSHVATKIGASALNIAKGEETPGLVAIAGAVAAVWVFALVMEKRKGW